jgi:hypothetical protein
MHIVIRSDNNTTSCFWEGKNTLATPKIMQNLLLIKALDENTESAPHR